MFSGQDLFDGSFLDPESAVLIVIDVFEGHGSPASESACDLEGLIRDAHIKVHALVPFVHRDDPKAIVLVLAVDHKQDADQSTLPGLHRLVMLKGGT